MIIQEFGNMEDAIWSFVKNHVRHDFFPHQLDEKEDAKLHYHKKAHEWLVASNGSFSIQIGDEQAEFDVKDRVLVILIPKGQRHALTALSKIRYFVIRDKKDFNIYIRAKKDGHNVQENQG